MPWIRLEIPCPPELTDVVAALVFAETGRGASVVSAGEQTVVEAWTSVGEAPQARQRLSQRLAAADKRLAGSVDSIRLVAVADVDWRLTWRKHFKPLRVGHRLVVKPSWEQWPPGNRPSAARPDDIVIEIDPAGAFGTGGHQTTQLALLALEERLAPGGQVVDVGCGSGILGLAALGLGASKVIGVDNDWAAIECAAANLAPYLPDGRARLLCGDGLCAVRADPDVVVANISAEAAIHVGRQALRLLRPGAAYITTGFLVARADAVRQELEGVGFRLEATHELDGWSCLSLVRVGSGDP